MEAADADPAAQMSDALRLALGEQAERELAARNLPYPAVQALFTLVLAAVTGEEAEAVQRRFRQAKAEL